MSAHPPKRLVNNLRQKPVVLSSVLRLTTLLVFAPTFHHAFLDFDDGQHVTQNEHVRTGFSLNNVAWPLPSFLCISNWHPITCLSHMADWRQLALHLVNVVLLFILLTGSVWRSFKVAALFRRSPIECGRMLPGWRRGRVFPVVFFRGGTFALALMSNRWP